MIAAGTRLAAGGLVAALMLLTCPPASAIDQPAVDAGAAVPPGSAGPIAPMAQRGECITTGLRVGTDVAAPSPNQLMLNLAGAWRFSRGEGQTVAVIDTGVRPGPRLPNVTGGGDYMAATDGLTDCDGHGTLVAGIIAGQPGHDGFSGVAPAAHLVSIRQTSAMYAPAAPGNDPVTTRAVIDIGSLARAVVRAADLGARVINISSVSCLPADSSVDQMALGAALRYAAVDKDAVVVSAAGNAGPVGFSGHAACQSNPGTWAGVTTASVPSWWQPYVLSVGSVAPDGQPSDFTMGGPWLGLAGPGQNVLSVSNSDGAALANGMPDGRGQLEPIEGTSFAAAYVSGVAALVRSRFPELTAPQVIERLAGSAHKGARAPSNMVGAGVVDPVAALTWELPSSAPLDKSDQKVAAPVVPPAPDHTSRNIALTGAGVLACVVAAVALTTHRRKERGR
ncbi:MAG TPA: type VII secretion-associated serine protease mycosin [Mycobacterium sp.]|nr:type VII secretion-associated serine protease mycosin [Mycobacterium sp.]